MLSAFQCEVVAFVTDGEIICPDCATSQYGELHVAKAEKGYEDAGDISPMIRYSLDEFLGERNYVCLDEGNPEDVLDFYPCDGCGKEIS